MIPGFLWVTQPEEFEQCRFVRTQVFIEEQGFSNEFDEMDQTAHHLLFLDDEKPVAPPGSFFTKGMACRPRLCALKLPGKGNRCVPHEGNASKSFGTGTEPSPVHQRPASGAPVL